MQDPIQGHSMWILPRKIPRTSASVLAPLPSLQQSSRLILDHVSGKARHGGYYLSWGPVHPVN
jgi:hypothetical protein